MSASAEVMRAERERNWRTFRKLEQFLSDLFCCTNEDRGVILDWVEEEDGLSFDDLRRLLMMIDGRLTEEERAEIANLSPDETEDIAAAPENPAEGKNGNVVPFTRPEETH